MKKLILFSLGMMFAILSLLSNNSIGVVSANNEISGIDSKSYILLDTKSGEILCEKSSHDKMPVASICKLMTTLITLEKIEAGILSIDDEVLASGYACSMEGSQAFLDEGCRYKVYDLLKSVIIASANDSSVVLAEAISGSENEFVKVMNNRAIELGMSNTFYENANGLPTPNQYSTAYDTAVILMEISQYDIYNELSNIWMDTLVHPSGRETELVNTNRLIRYYDYCLNGKTGYTDEAGYCLASTASNDNLTLVAVVLNGEEASTRFSDSVKLYDYGFANFESVKVIEKNQKMCDIDVSGGVVDKISLVTEDDYFVLSKKGGENNVDIRCNIEDTIHAPILKNSVLGKCDIVKGGKVVGTINLISTIDIESQGFGDILKKIANNWNII